MMIFRNEALTVRLLEEDDAPLLVRWLSDPQVLQYYEGRDRPHTPDMVKEHFYTRTEELTPCIVQYEGVNIGYLQYYPVDDEERAEYGYDDPAEIVYGMDQFIGEIAYWDRGIGSLLVRSTVEYLTGRLGASAVVMDPQTWNTRALRCYEKCGFQRKKLLPKRELHEGEFRDCWLMEYRPAPAAQPIALTLRKATTEDVPALARMNKRMIEDENNVNPMSLSELEQRMHMLLKNEWNIDLICSGSQVVGYALYSFRLNPYFPDRTEVYVRHYYIEREVRSRGFGRQGIKLLQEQRFNGASLTIDVLESNPRGRNFWESVGFEPYCTTMKLPPDLKL